MHYFKPTVLLVDDIEINLRLLENTLKNYYNIETAQSGEEAVEKVSKLKIDVILLDIQMPKMDGYEVCKMLKQDDETKDIPVIFVTGNTSSESEEKCFEIGAVDYITKPINISTLLARVKTHITLRLQKVQLNQSQKLLQEYKEAVDEGSIVSKSDITGKITYVNNQFCKISGYAKDELIGKQHKILRHCDMPKAIFENLWHTIKVLKKTWHGELKNRKKDGSHYWVEATIKPILDTKGNIIEFIALRTDITEIQNYKEFLRKKLDSTSLSFHEYEDAIVHNSAIAKLSSDLTIKFVNNKYLELAKYEFEEMIGKPITNFIADASLENIEHILNIVKKGETHTTNFQGKPKYGEAFFTETTIKPIKNTSGEIVEYLLIKHDVTPLVNSHLEIIATQKEIIYKMGEIAESRSQETGNHVKRVAEYSRLLALLAELSEDEAEILFIASPMHDIGKVGIPDSVLNKPGILNEEEWKIMKKHSSIGYKILKGSNKEVLKAAAIVAYEHHEKWDGSGYPRKLKGESIHIYGRITAIADVFDALGSHRCYKKAWELEKILELFNQEKGKHFDPNLINLFFENLDKFLEIRDKFEDKIINV